MSQRDYNKQVAKRQRIRKGTLIVGVDIGKAFNAVGFMNKAGKELRLIDTVIEDGPLRQLRTLSKARERLSDTA